jgi:transketolase
MRGTKGGRVRTAFVTALADLADSDQRVLLLTGDLGFMAVEPFAERHPDRFINVGVAEQNMVGMATGLAEAGYVPFVYSIATFAALRTYEFIRNGPVLHELPVRVVGVGPGLDYGANGITHWALEDVAVLRPLPGLALITPADDPQTASAVAATRAIAGPAYLRLARTGPAIAGLDGRFALGRAHVLGAGSDIALVALGNMASTALEAQALLAGSGVDARVVVVSCVRPAPTHDLVTALTDVPLAISVESHYVDGGAGSLTAEVIAENGLATRLVRAGVRRSPAGVTGSSEFLHDLHGLSARTLVQRALEQLASRPRPLRRIA